MLCVNIKTCKGHYYKVTPSTDIKNAVTDQSEYPAYVLINLVIKIFFPYHLT
jgi:hypothetical protein